MFRLLVNGKEPNRGDETEIRKRLKSLYKGQLLEVALEYRYIGNFLKKELDKLKQQNTKWQELKEWLDKCSNLKEKKTYMSFESIILIVKNKMQELEAKNEN